MLKYFLFISVLFCYTFGADIDRLDSSLKQEKELKNYEKFFNKSGDVPSGLEFFRFYKNELENFYNAVLKGSKEKNFVTFRRFNLIEYTEYKKLNKAEFNKIASPLVLFRGIFLDSPMYSEFGGVSIKSSSYGDESVVYLLFDGRYLSDIEEIKDSGNEFYAYCSLVKVNKCILLGIGEAW